MATVTKWNEWNAKIIEEFRANEGRVGGPFEGATLLLLHTTGRKTGRPYVSPLMYLPDGDRYVIFASKGGAPTDPDWYRNLEADPAATIEVGTQTIPVRATVVTGPERDDLYARQARLRPQFAEYAQKAGRVIPVIALERAG
jgi:deazaflavin-dependent oxidoreductase (nitroreductase family)